MIGVSTTSIWCGQAIFAKLGEAPRPVGLTGRGVKSLVNDAKNKKLVQVESSWS